MLLATFARYAMSAVMVISTLLGSGVHGKPVKRSSSSTINNPCGPNTGNSFLPLPAEITNVIGALNNLIQASRAAMNAYQQQDLLLDQEIAMLSSPMQNLQGLPFRDDDLPEDVSASSELTLARVLRRAYLQASVHTLLLDTVKREGTEWDLSMDSVLDNVSGALLSSMCTFQGAAGALTQTMPVELRELDDEVSMLDYEVLNATDPLSALTDMVSAKIVCNNGYVILRAIAQTASSVIGQLM